MEHDKYILIFKAYQTVHSNLVKCSHHIKEVIEDMIIPQYCNELVSNQQNFVYEIKSISHNYLVIYLEYNRDSDIEEELKEKIETNFQDDLNYGLRIFTGTNLYRFKLKKIKHSNDDKQPFRI
jgi:hypothetical protein